MLINLITLLRLLRHNEQKATACAEISCQGPLVAPHSSPRVVSYAAPVTAGLLCYVFEDIGISSVTVVAFGMKDTRYMHGITDVPTISPDPSVMRRYDLGLNKHLSENVAERPWNGVS